eukprot:1161003-Pelagomonas_calceolata.AAC.6
MQSTACSHSGSPLSCALRHCLQLSALIASEWYMRNDFFPGWGRPYEFGAELLADQKRDEEARDMARCGCLEPREVQGVTRGFGAAQKTLHNSSGLPDMPLKTLGFSTKNKSCPLKIFGLTRPDLACARGFELFC